MSDDDVFYRISTIMNVDPAEIAKIVHDYIERDIGCGTLYDRFNSPPPPIYIGPVKVETLKERLDNYKKHKHIKEDNEMNATSTEEFKDIIAVDFELQTFPNPDVDDKFIVSATNRDDIFCFVFEGPNLRDACRNAGLFTGWEKDQKIRELEKENKRMEENLNSQHEMIKELNQKNLKLQEENEKLKQQLQKVERDKKRLTGRYEWLNSCYNGLLKDYQQLVDRILELEELKTPTIENFADEEPVDNVNHPSHYTGRYECIDVMQDVFGDEATDNFCLCNAFKYIWRARKKNGLEDVKKAVWYLNKYIEEAEKDGVSKGE